MAQQPICTCTVDAIIAKVVVAAHQLLEHGHFSLVRQPSLQKLHQSKLWCLCMPRRDDATILPNCLNLRPGFVAMSMIACPLTKLYDSSGTLNDASHYSISRENISLFTVCVRNTLCGRMSPTKERRASQRCGCRGLRSTGISPPRF